MSLPNVKEFTAKNDIFRSQCYAYVNPVNTVGVMGAGLAKQFKDKFPTMFDDYKQACKDKKIKIGECWAWDNEVVQPPPHVVVCFPTKDHYRNDSKIEFIDAGLLSLIYVIHSWHIPSIAIPPLGCGLGGLDWNVVRERILELCALMPHVQFELYAPEVEAKTNGFTTRRFW